MGPRRQRERSRFEILLPDGHTLWPDWLRKIDTRLEDDAVMETVARGLEARWPERRRRGRPGTPAEVVLRMLILKHVFDWSDDDLEREVRANLVFRAFTRLDADEVPDATDSAMLQDGVRLRRCRYHGAAGTARSVGRGVIANTLASTATFMTARAIAYAAPMK
jgi:hypothetical protein